MMPLSAVPRIKATNVDSTANPLALASKLLRVGLCWIAGASPSQRGKQASSLFMCGVHRLTGMSGPSLCPIEAHPSAYRVAAIHCECVTDDEACARATKPKNGGGNLLWPTQSPNGYVLHHLFHGFCFTGQHAFDHRRLNDTRTYSVDTDAPRGIFERSALREPKHTVLGGVIHSPTGDAHETTTRRVADDRAAPLLAHLAQLVFHAVPNAAEIDRVDAVEFFATRIGGLGYRTLHTSIIERGINPSEGGDGLLDHGCHLFLIGYVAANGERPVAPGE